MASFGKENSFFYVKKGDMKARKMNTKGGIILRAEEMYKDKYEKVQLWQKKSKVTPKWYKSDESAWEIKVGIRMRAEERLERLKAKAVRVVTRAAKYSLKNNDKCNFEF